MKWLIAIIMVIAILGCDNHRCPQSKQETVEKPKRVKVLVQKGLDMEKTFDYTKDGFKHFIRYQCVVDKCIIISVGINKIRFRGDMYTGKEWIYRQKTSKYPVTLKYGESVWIREDDWKGRIEVKIQTDKGMQTFY